LAKRGHHVIAVEPTEALRGHGQALHADLPIKWVDDALPELGIARTRTDPGAREP
jgi:hypothetical protein